MRNYAALISALVVFWAFQAGEAWADDCISAQDHISRGKIELQKNPTEAARLFGRAVELCPRSAAAQYDLGLARFGLSDFDGAVSAFEAALRLKPNMAEAMNALVMAYAMSGHEWKRAEGLLEQAMKIRPGDAILAETKRTLHAARSVHELPPAASLRKDSFAIVIGIEQYRDIPPVLNAESDARWFREYLVKVLGVPEENIIMLLNERASRTDILKYVDVWLQNNASPGSRVYLYYAGHGAPDVKTKKAYIVPFDGDPNYLKTTAYPLDDLYASLQGLPAAEILVFMDSCFSGSGERSVVAEGMRPIALSIENPALASGKMAVMSAAEGTQASSYFKEGGHGLFTYYLMLGLKGEADADRDGWVSVSELYDYVKPNVIGQARKLNRDQSPTLMPPSGSQLGILSTRLSQTRK